MTGIVDADLVTKRYGEVLGLNGPSCRGERRRCSTCRYRRP